MLNGAMTFETASIWVVVWLLIKESGVFKAQEWWLSLQTAIKKQEKIELNWGTLAHIGILLATTGIYPII